LNGRNHPLVATFVAAVRASRTEHFGSGLRKIRTENEFRRDSEKEEMAARA
jgi:hypothetical protein